MPQTTNGLTALFLEHAAGMVTFRALRERQTRILRYMAAHKYNISEDKFRELHAELDEIEAALEKCHEQ